MKRREVIAGLAALPLATILYGRHAMAQSVGSTLRVIHGSNLSSIDPIWTTAQATNDLAMLVYDQLFGMDNDYKMQPQMVESWTVDDESRTYEMTLRPGLLFHDGEPVRAVDCVASIRRWAKKDGTGQSLGALTESMDVIDDRTFRIRLTQPFAWVPDVLGKPNSSQCVIMPERHAILDPSEQIPEAIGSGPFRFLADEFVSGSHAAFEKFADYVPRSEPINGNAGGKIANVDRVEWSFISDPSTAMASLMAGEHDYWDSPLPDLVPVMRQNPDLVVEQRSLAGIFYTLVMNHLQPPFDNPKVREAVAMAVNQEEFMAAAAGGDPGSTGYCASFYMCGTPYATEDAGEILKIRDIEKAKAALAESGYAGEKVVLLGVTDPPALSAISQVTNDLLVRMGFNVEFVATDFAGMTQRRTSKDCVDNGGWSVFNSTYGGLGLLTPLTNIFLRGAGENSWFGWPTNPELEALRAEWFSETDPARQAELAELIQVEGFKTLPYIPIGFAQLTHAWRKDLTGVEKAPLAPFWNIGKPA